MRNMIDFKKQLNRQQYRVVNQGDGPCLVLAGAGSGKTRVITYRVAYLLQNGLSAGNILLVTFTNKAAAEMIERVQTLTGGKIRLPWSGTFHHIGYSILRRYAPVLGYRRNFSILDSQDSRDLLKICLKLEGIDRTQRRFPSDKIIQNILSYARNAEISITDVLEVKYPKWLDFSDSISRIGQEYGKRKKQANAMDFDDLLVNLYILLLKSSGVREKFARRFEYVLVDEYQDTNKIQASIINLFSCYHHNLLVVGDDAQSIYSFRAANIQNILDFEKKYPRARIFKLETNYRSTPEILSVANQVISNNRNQYEKNLKSVIRPFVRPEVKAFADQNEEAEFVAERVLELRDEGVDLNSIAVLFRAAFHSQALEMELSKRDIPYDYRGGVRFFERAHIKDVLSYLRILNNKQDAIAWSRILNMQTGIGPVGAENIMEKIKQMVNIDDIAEFLGARAQIGWNNFLQIWRRLEKKSKDEEEKPADLVEAMLESKYVDYLESEYPDYRERIQDIEQLAVFARLQKNLNSFLAQASLQESYASNQVKSDSSHCDKEKIILSTVHQAKGLEWEAVFLINLAAGQFPNERARQEGGLEEERRLFYVAITRAKKYLHLTYPIVGGVSGYPQGQSLFLEELSSDLIDSYELGEETVFSDPSDDVDDIVYEPIDQQKKGFLKSIDRL